MAADWHKFFPPLTWGRQYNAGHFSDDLFAALIVTIMLIPQSLAYALLAGLPAEVGLYASILPLVAYGLLGTSSSLAVGPVAVVSLMTAAAIGNLGVDDPDTKILLAVGLACLSGLMLCAMGILRLGFLANFLSHPVISGFISASGLLIAASQLKHLLGISASGHHVPSLLVELFTRLDEINLITFFIGFGTLGFLLFMRQKCKPLLLQWGVPPKIADIMVKAGPVAAVAVTIMLTAFGGLDQQGVAIVGSIPQGLPSLGLQLPSSEMLSALLLPALLISLVGFVESVSVAQTLAAKKRQHIDPDQELLGLGAANIASGLSGGYPVTGGFARSVVNFDAGAATPAAGIFTAFGIGLATWYLTPFLFYLPKATLAATIMVAVLSLVNFKSLWQAWSYSKADFFAQLSTMLVTLSVGVELGIVAGVGLGLVFVLYRLSQPHAAVVGRVPGTQHYRNVKRHHVHTSAHVFALRLDENLFFANIRKLEDLVLMEVAENKDVRDVVLMCSAVNFIDFSALEGLEELNHRLEDAGVRLHLSEVKGPVMDRLQRSFFLHALSGEIFLSQHEAMVTLDPQHFSS